MKALFVTLLFPVLLKSCDGQPDQVGHEPLPVPTSSSSNSGGNTGSSTGDPTPTDVPIDGGIGVLLVAGAAYGVKRYRGKTSKPE